MVDGRTEIYGIIGYPVAHSLSPAMHNAAFAARGLNAVYLPFPVEDVGAALGGFAHLGIRGASVTIPHKETVLAFVDDIDPVAAKIGAVNTLVVTGSGGEKRLFGTNTDWIGANRALAEQMTLAGSRVAVLGAGGSARAIGFGLLEAGATVEIHSRTESRGRALARLLDCAWKPLTDSSAAGLDGVVNATSVGMAPQDTISPVTPALLKRCRVVMDIVYAPLQTVLLREAAAAGCVCINGLEMLLYQGVAQFELWTGVTAPVDVMREALLRATGNRNLPSTDTNTPESDD